MKYQVDKMLKVALSGGKGMDESLNYAPNPDQLVGQDGAAGDDDDEDNASDGEGGRGKDGVYRAPRLAAVPYEEDERAAVKQAKKDERNRKRLQKSTILSELREEFSERPTEILASGTSVLDKEIAREEAEKKAFEEERFVRLVTSRKDKIRKRQREQEANRADNVGAIDNFAGVQSILSSDKGKRRIPTHAEPIKRVGGKTGGIFSHVEAPVRRRLTTVSALCGELLLTIASRRVIYRRKRSARCRALRLVPTLRPDRSSSVRLLRSSQARPRPRSRWGRRRSCSRTYSRKKAFSP